MATVSRVHGSNTQVGTLYNPNANLFKIAVKTSAPAAVDLQTEDSYGLNAVVYGVIEAIVDELNPLIWFTPAATSGYIHVILDIKNDSASELQTRIRRVTGQRDITGTTNATTTLTTTAATNVTLPRAGTLVSTGNDLSVFAATTSAQLAGVISDETGTGSVVFSNSPTLVTPTLGAALATTINGTSIPSSATLLTSTTGVTTVNGSSGAISNIAVTNANTNSRAKWI